MGVIISILNALPGGLATVAKSDLVSFFLDLIEQKPKYKSVPVNTVAKAKGMFEFNPILPIAMEFARKAATLQMKIMSSIYFFNYFKFWIRHPMMKVRLHALKSIYDIQIHSSTPTRSISRKPSAIKALQLAVDSKNLKQQIEKFNVADSILFDATRVEKHALTILEQSWPVVKTRKQNFAQFCEPLAKLILASEYGGKFVVPSQKGNLLAQF
jgi:hypothetical protein